MEHKKTSSTTMSRLMELPTEILLTILSFLDLDGNRTYLSHLSKVSRKAQGLVQPLLFRKYKVVLARPLDISDGYH
jgi:hypothetical protein